MHTFSPRHLRLAFVLLALAGCAQPGTQPTSEARPAAPPPAAPAASRGPAPGMNANGEVIDSKLVSSGHGEHVKGIGNWQGEITGKPAKGSGFTRLQIGMPMQQVVDMIGRPSDSGAYVTGKAWIPFYFGSDRYRYEFVYKNQGRLIFAGGSIGNYSGGNLIWIIHNGTEPGYR